MDIVLLIIGFVLLVKGADFFVSGASDIARKLKVSALIIGLTIVAFGTSAPELAVSISASSQGSSSISVGNIIGPTCSIFWSCSVHPQQSYPL